MNLSSNPNWIFRAAIRSRLSARKIGGDLMFKSVVVAVAMLAASGGGGFAKDEPQKENCTTFDYDGIIGLLEQAPSCLRAIAIFEACEFGASGDVGLGAAVTKKCEADFMGKLSAAQKRAYDQAQKRCARKYRNKSGTMYRSFEAFCGAYVARDYSARFLKASAGKGR